MVNHQGFGVSYSRAEVQASPRRGPSQRRTARGQRAAAAMNDPTYLQPATGINDADPEDDLP